MKQAAFCFTAVAECSDSEMHQRKLVTVIKHTGTSGST